MQYRRLRTPGGTYFFTVVTFERQKILCDPINVSLLKDAFAHVRKSLPFVIDAFVLLPDHMHCIWSLPEEESDFPERWRLIKSYFSRRYGNENSREVSVSRQSKKEREIWQRRFWEHRIRSQEDFNRHIEYIHYNPLKHGYVKDLRDWPYSTFHRYVRAGIYDEDFGESYEDIFDGMIGME
jgi:putative transposase